MPSASLKAINEKEPSTLAKIVMEVEPLTEEEKKLMLKQVRMRKAVLMAEKLKGAVLPNNISISQIVAEQKKMQLHNFPGSFLPFFISFLISIIF